MTLPTDLDSALMLKVREGDSAAFEELVQKHHTSVINTIHRMLGDRWEAEDLAQQVFVQVYRSANRYQATAKFSTWLFTIVRHLTLNEIRRRSRHRADSLDEPRQEGDEEWKRQVADPAATAPDQTALQQELELRVRSAVGALPEQQRMAIVLLRHEQLSYEEIGKVMGVSLSALKSILHRARLTLREELGKYLEEKQG
jgi:RNA polymerase sigma-70 factor (ECF subfamily)